MAKIVRVLVVAVVPLIAITAGAVMNPVVSEDEPWTSGCNVGPEDLVLDAPPPNGDPNTPAFEPSAASNPLGGPPMAIPVSIDMNVDPDAVFEKVTEEVTATGCGIELLEVVHFSDGTQVLVDPGVLRVEKVNDGTYRAIYHEVGE